MTTRTESGPSPRAAPEDARAARTVAQVVAALTLVLHLATNGRYGFFRDELYFLVCGQRLAWGYVDQPPVVAVLARLATTIFGHSLAGIRTVPALASAGLVLLTAAVVRRLRGGVPATLLATVAVAVGPVFAVGGHLFTMNAFEPLFWTGIALVLLRLLETQGTSLRDWIALALLVGVGFLNKYGVAFWTAGCLAGLLLTRTGRAALRPRWLAVAMALAALVVLPNLAWQWARGFPMRELLRNGQLGKNAPFSLGDFAVQLLTLPGPPAALLWMGGVLVALRSEARRWAPLGVAALVTIGLMVLGKAKGYYVAPLFPTFLAFGAVGFERRVRRRSARVAAIAVVAVAGLVILPMAIPVLPPDLLVRYLAAIRLQPHRDEQHAFNALPQHFADQFGWPGLVEAVARAAGRLPPEERSRAVVYTFNYGEAAALEFLGEGRGLPRVVSGHNQYWHWRERGTSLEPFLIIGSSVENLRHDFEHVELVGRTPKDPLVMPYESDRPIHLCRGLKSPPETFWDGERHYD